ncbi:MAG: glycosyltransferase family 2 protein [Cyanobacteria bacterium]|nr:glycosyltransferase family 2 protein [Cyanobacteriota bacterium]
MRHLILVPRLLRLNPIESQQLNISVVIPVYNSEGTLQPLLSAIESTLRKMAGEYEVILINDGSHDSSWNVIKQLRAHNPRVRGINMLRNYGQHNAVLCGIRAARNEVIITLDDDLQNPPSEIPKLLAKLEEGYDVVYGTPENEQHGFMRDVASVMTKVVWQKILGAKTARDLSAFRAMRTKIRDAFTHYHGPFVSVDVLLTWGTTKFASIKVKHNPRAQGRSNYTLMKLISHAITITTGFSTLPLQFATFGGAVCLLLGVVLLIYVVARALLEGSPPGFPFLASIVIIFSSAQLLAMGIIGEYVGRISSRVMARPAYAVDSEETESDEEIESVALVGAGER